MNEWIKTLEQGSSVAMAYFIGHKREKHIQIRTVAKITPKGQIVLDDGSRFNPDGKKRGDSNITIEQVTNNVVSQRKKNHMVKRLANVKWSTLSTDQLIALEKILDEMPIEQA